MKGTQGLVDHLLEQIFTTDTLKEISDILEELAQDHKFKLHTNAIVTDTSLTDPQKKRQLSYILKMIDNSLLYEFLSDVAGRDLWLFSSDRVDYFDKFVQQFQRSTEDVGLVYLVTAIELEATDLKKIAQDLGKAFGYKVIVKHEINKAIVGGAQVRVENMVFDYSLRTKFQQFERTWISSLKKTEKRIGVNQTD